MSTSVNPYGDGRASQKIVDIIVNAFKDNKETRQVKYMIMKHNGLSIICTCLIFDFDLQQKEHK